MSIEPELDSGYRFSSNKWIIIGSIILLLAALCR